jgi:hypothetical protein
VFPDTHWYVCPHLSTTSSIRTGYVYNLQRVRLHLFSLASQRLSCQKTLLETIFWKYFRYTVVALLWMSSSDPRWNSCKLTFTFGNIKFSWGRTWASTEDVQTLVLIFWPELDLPNVMCGKAQCRNKEAPCLVSVFYRRITLRERSKTWRQTDRLLQWLITLIQIHQITKVSTFSSAICKHFRSPRVWSFPLGTLALVSGSCWKKPSVLISFCFQTVPTDIP